MTFCTAASLFRAALAVLRAGGISRIGSAVKIFFFSSTLTRARPTNVAAKSSSELSLFDIV
jgi:hypothetical protein